MQMKVLQAVMYKRDTCKVVALDPYEGGKATVAEAAAACVADKETVLIESGSVCALLADILVRSDRGISIVTNSVFISNYVRQAPGASVTFEGYQSIDGCFCTACIFTGQG